MSKVEKLVVICVVVGLIVAASGTAQANWEETFDGNAFDLTTWLFRAYPELTGTFSATIQDGLDDDDYLVLDEPGPANVGGSQFGVGIGVPDDIFSDVRVGAVFNVNGDASLNYHGLAARISYFIDPDGSLSGYPGIVASTYVMTIHYEEGPANLKIEMVKIVNLSDEIMETWEPEVPVPGLDHAKSHYFELDVVGSDPVYITGSVYEYKGGPLLVRTPTFIDTNANDPWERPGINDAVFTSGASGIFSSWADVHPVVGYHGSFDSVSSVSDGPAAVNPSPVDGATDVSVNVDLSWVEAEFATSRELWLGRVGAMEKVEPAPTGTTYTGALEFGQTYQWRVDQIGPSGTVTGHTWSFTTEECMSVEDFESYADHAGIRAEWIENIADFDYVFLATDDQGNSMLFEFQNQYEPYVTEATRTFNSPQDWTAQGVEALSLSFVGVNENMEHLMYLKLEDAAGQSFKAEHPYTHACQSDSWQEWTVALEQFSSGGVDLGSVKKIAIGLGNGTTSSGQEGDDKDHIYIDQIRLCPAGCINVEQVDLRGDINGDCKVDIEDLLILMDNWLNEG